MIGEPIRIEEPNAVINRKTDCEKPLRRLVEIGLKVKGPKA
jgi:hypothetical protein